MIEINGENLSIEDVVKISRDFESVRLSEDAIRKIQKSREMVESIVGQNKIVYGINTGFGELAKETIPYDSIDELQHNLIRSHSCGVGHPLPAEIVRAMMVLRANSLAKGYSGIRLDTVNVLIDMLNKKVHPIVPEKGSIGASGDLIPLAHIALAIIGEGNVEYNGEMVSTEEGFQKSRIYPVKLTAKEGLALINGTQLMTAIGCLAIWDAELLLKNVQIAGVMSLEALKGTDQAFRDEIHKARPHKGQMTCAKNLWRLTRESKIIASHKDCSEIQDAYTLRCMPQVFGASKDAFSFVRSVLETEINSATDNPLIFPDIGESLSGGNFHGQPLALALDFLGIAVAELGNFSERRTARLVDSNLSGLPPFLTEHSGLHSGFMLPQYVAASLVSENKILCHPASCDSIPSSANKEDHVSMGAIAALKSLKILENVQRTIAIEFMAASQGLEFHRPLESSPGINVAHSIIRGKVPKLEKDRPMYEDIEKLFCIVKNGAIVQSVEQIIGRLE